MVKLSCCQYASLQSLSPSRLPQHPILPSTRLAAAAARHTQRICSTRLQVHAASTKASQAAAVDGVTKRLAAFRQDIERELPLPLPVGIQYTPALKQYTGQHLVNLATALAADILILAAQHNQSAQKPNGVPAGAPRGALEGPTQFWQDFAVLTPGNYANFVIAGDMVRRALHNADTHVMVDSVLEEGFREAQELTGVLAEEIRLRLINRHSGRDVFNAPEVVALLEAYSVLSIRTPSQSVGRLLDTMAGFVVKRINSGHLHAVSRPQDIVRLLRCYAVMVHNSVAIWELMECVEDELKRQVASSYERRDDSGTSLANDITVQLLCSLMESSITLGRLPAEGTLSAVLTASWQNLAEADLEDAVKLLKLLAAVQHRPSDWWLQLLVARLQDGLLAGELSVLAAGDSVKVLGDLGYSVPLEMLSTLLEKLLENPVETDQPEVPGALLTTASMACACNSLDAEMMNKMLLHLSQASLSFEQSVSLGHILIHMGVSHGSHSPPGECIPLLTSAMEALQVQAYQDPPGLDYWVDHLSSALQNTQTGSGRKLAMTSCLWHGMPGTTNYLLVVHRTEANVDVADSKLQGSAMSTREAERKRISPNKPRPIPPRDAASLTVATTPATATTAIAGKTASSRADSPADSAEPSQNGTSDNTGANGFSEVGFGFLGDLGDLQAEESASEDAWEAVRERDNGEEGFQEGFGFLGDLLEIQESAKEGGREATNLGTAVLMPAAINNAMQQRITQQQIANKMPYFTGIPLSLFARYALQTLLPPDLHPYLLTPSSTNDSQDPSEALQLISSSTTDSQDPSRGPLGGPSVVLAVCRPSLSSNPPHVMSCWAQWQVSVLRDSLPAVHLKVVRFYEWSSLQGLETQHAYASNLLEQSKRLR